MYSIYHFFAHLLRNKVQLVDAAKLDEFRFDTELLSCQNDGVFPDLAIRVNVGDARFSGGELIELKDSKGYSIASFNSTIPTGTKDIRAVVASEHSKIYRQMRERGDDVFALAERQVFYLIRGRRKGRTKICLVHGSFFETVRVDDLIRAAFAQVFEEGIQSAQVEMEDAVKQVLLKIFSEQKRFSKVRDVEQASVKLRFRVMTEAKAEGNLLNPKKYPQIQDDTLNFVVPRHTETVEIQERETLQSVISPSEFSSLRVLTIKHLLNGDFLVFQADLGANNE